MLAATPKAPCAARARNARGRQALAFVAGTAFLAALGGIAMLLQRTAGRGGGPPAISGSQLFDMSRIWEVHLRFTPEAWDAMEPAGGFGGPPGNPPQPGGAPGPGGGPGPGGAFGPGGAAAGFPPDFGPGTFTAPVFLREGDTNQDGKLSRDEFAGLAEMWFADWGAAGDGFLDGTRLRDGLNRTLGPPGPPPAGGIGQGPPGPMFLGREGKRNGVLGAMGLEFPSVRADLEFQGLRIPSVSVRYKGNGTFLESRGALKRSLKIDLNDGFRGRKLGGVTKLNLHSNVTDAGCMNEVLAYSLYRAAGVPAPRTAYARVYLTVPGRHDARYLGLYSLVENVDNAFAQDRFGTRKGALFKPVPRQLFEDLGDDWEAYRPLYDPKTPVSGEETARIIAFSRLVSHADDAEFAARVEEYLDLEEFASFMAVTVWLSTLDSILGMGQNYLLYLHPKTRRFLFIPWDLDHAFGQFYPIGTPEQRENLSIRKPWAGDVRFLERVFRVERFRSLYLSRLAELSESVLRPERILRSVDELAAVLRPAVADESPERLARFDRVAAGEPLPAPGFGPPPGGGGPGAGSWGPFPGIGAPGPAPAAGPTGRDPGATRGPLPGAPLPAPGGFGPPPQGQAPFGPPGLGPPAPGVWPPGPGSPAAGPVPGAPPGLPPFSPPPAKSLKGFVAARAVSVRDQLEGRSEGMTVAPFGFGGPGGGPPGAGQPGSPPALPEGFGPGLFLGPVFLAELDQDKDGKVTRAEFAEGFRRWFREWDRDGTGTLTEAQLRAGLNRALKPFRGVPPGIPGPEVPGSPGAGPPGPRPGPAPGRAGPREPPPAPGGPPAPDP